VLTPGWLCACGSQAGVHGQQLEVHSQSVMAWMIVILAGVTAGLLLGRRLCCQQAPILPTVQGQIGPAGIAHLDSS